MINDILIMYNIFLVINTLSLLLLGIGYFMSKFKIVDLETWKASMEIVEEYAQMKENENCGGGVGFQIYNEEEVEEDYEEEEKKESNNYVKKDKHSKK